MAKHAFLAASASERWLHCPPSAKLCAQEDDQGSEYARQGSDAHALCEHLLLKALGRETRDPTEDLTYYDAEMQEAAEAYAAFVMEQVAEAKTVCHDPLICVEQTVDFSKWVQHGFGTADALIVADDTLYDINRIRLSIFQPRRENIDTFELTKTDLLQWADDFLAPIAKLAYEGQGEFEAGNHCQFCRVKATCRKRAEYAMELAKYEFADAPTLDENEIAEILPQIDTLVSWAEDIKSYALNQALSGVRYPGFKLVAGRSNRKYADEAAVARVVSEAGYDPYDKKLVGITEMTKRLGKKRFEELLNGLLIKPEGKPVLVPATDTRPELNNAKNDFMEE